MPFEVPPEPARVACAPRLELLALSGMPLVSEGNDLVALLEASLVASGVGLADGDVLVVTSKILSRAEGRFVSLARVTPSAEARDLAHATRKDPRLVEVILGETKHVVRAAPNVLIVRHRLGFVCANAGVDCSNSVPVGATEPGPWALLLPRDPDATAARICEALRARTGKRVGVVVSDSFGRPFRFGTVGVAVGAAGLPALWDRRGEDDLFGRKLEHTVTALADQVAAAADLVAGQAAEGRAAVVVRGLAFADAHPSEEGADKLLRPEHEDLFAGRGRP